jgi:hypothetical protein
VRKFAYHRDLLLGKAKLRTRLFRTKTKRMLEKMGMTFSFEEFHLGFASQEAWKAFVAKHREIRDAERLRRMAEGMVRDGFLCPFSGERATPGSFSFDASNYRESFVFRGLSCRMRAMLMAVTEQVGTRPEREVRIYAPEAFSPFALALRGRYPRFVGSEFTTNPEVRAGLFPVPFEDLQALSFPDDSFDIVVVNDVFEHVPDLDQTLREIQRVLRPKGVLLSTFPFAPNRHDTVIRARLGAAGVEHLAPPEYHGDPMDPEGVLVFQVPAWDILDRCKAAGYGQSEMVLHASARHGVMETYLPGIFFLQATK